MATLWLLAEMYGILIINATARLFRGAPETLDDTFDDPDLVLRNFIEYEDLENEHIAKQFFYAKTCTNANDVFQVTELLESILEHLPRAKVFQYRGVNKHWQEVINGSLILQRKMFFALEPRSSTLTDSEERSQEMLDLLPDGFSILSETGCECSIGSDHSLKRLQKCGFNYFLWNLLIPSEYRDPLFANKAWEEGDFIFMPGRKYDWGLQKFQLEGDYHVDVGDGMFDVRVVAVPKNHGLIKKSTASTTFCAQASKSYLAQSNIKHPVLLTVYRLEARESYTERIWETEPIFAVRHDAFGDTHVVPTVHHPDEAQHELGETPMAETNFKTPYIDNEFSVDVTYGDLLKWAEDRMELQIGKTRRFAWEQF